jgi:hypothetical protein
MEIRGATKKFLEFFDIDSLVHHEFILPGQSVTGHFYSSYCLDRVLLVISTVHTAWTECYWSFLQFIPPGQSVTGHFYMQVLQRIHNSSEEEL